jgi:DNA polymerase III epsilon subunit-like protein
MKPTEEQQKEHKVRAEEWATERLADLQTVIVDTETTGLPSKDPDTEICQLAVTDVKGKPLFCMLIKPNKPMGNEVISIHGITNEQVVNQPTFPQVAKLISFILEDKHIACYNADFDVKLLWSLYKKYDQPLPKIAGASCVMDKYSEWVGEWNEKRNGFKWQRLPNLSGMPAHDAFSDCISTLKAMELMASKFDPSQVEADEIDLDF